MVPDAPLDARKLPSQAFTQHRKLPGNGIISAIFNRPFTEVGEVSFGRSRASCPGCNNPAGNSPGAGDCSAERTLGPWSPYCFSLLCCLLHAFRLAQSDFWAS